MISMDDFDRIVDAAKSAGWYVSWKPTSKKRYEFEFRYSAPTEEGFAFTKTAGSLSELVDNIKDAYDLSHAACSRRIWSAASWNVWHEADNETKIDLKALCAQLTDIQTAMRQLGVELSKLTKES